MSEFVKRILYNNLNLFSIMIITSNLSSGGMREWLHCTSHQAVHPVEKQENG